MERNNRKVYTGTVVSTKMDKTITVLVETHVKHVNKTIICYKTFPFSRNRKKSRNSLIDSKRR